MSQAKSFFEEAKAHSIVKSALVDKYFRAWLKIMLLKFSGNIGYIDLFSGPGRYADGTASTPIQVLRSALLVDGATDRFVSLFSDKDANITGILAQEIAKIPGISLLKHQPEILTRRVEPEFVEEFQNMRLVPSLIFLDPFGYEGLTQDLLEAMLKDRGCDCIFFFNYDRINPALNNPLVKEHMRALFGAQQADTLDNRLRTLKPEERELEILEALTTTLQSNGKRYVLPFRFRNPNRNRTTHHIIFVSKHLLGFKIMKEIMAKESSIQEEGVASFEYNPASKKLQRLFNFCRPLDDLKAILLRDFSGVTMAMKDIFHPHHGSYRFIEKNYKDALMEMEAEGIVTCSPPSGSRQRRNGQATMGENTLITFPRD